MKNTVLQNIRLRSSRSVCYVLFCVLFLFLLLFTSAIGYAENYSLFSSLNPEDNIAKNLVGFYINQPDYDPYNEYYCCRTGQYDYYLFYGRSLSGDYKYIHYYGVQNGYNLSYFYSVGGGSNLIISSNGFIGVGNIENSIISDKAENYKYYFVITILLFLICFVLIFKFFKVHFKSKSGGWDI